MGGKEVEQNTTTPQDVIDYLNELCAYALSLGMSYETYWRDDPQIINRYIRAEELRLSRKNQEMWLQGFYIYQAVGSLSPILNALSKEKKARKYLERPIPITDRERAEMEQARVNKIVRKLDALVGKKLR